MNLPIASERSSVFQLRNIRSGLESLAAKIDTGDKTAPAWTPNPDSPQVTALTSEASIIGYGGGAGGGKTDLLLGMALTTARKATIYRLHKEDLQDMRDRGDEILAKAGVDCHYNYNRRRWSTPDGRHVHLEAAENIKDIRKYRGRARDFIGFDEAQEFPEDLIRTLDAWRRTTVKGQRTHLVLTFNPPGTETGDWLINFFAPWLDEDYENPAAPGELRWFIRYNDEEREVPGPEPIDLDGTIYRPESRTFIPALVQDNPHLRDTEYVVHLMNMKEPMRSMFLLGQFKKDRPDDDWQLIPTRHLDAAQERWKNMDPPDLLMRALGIDVARGGRDNSVLAPVFGDYIGKLLVIAGKDTPDGDSLRDLVIRLLKADRRYIDHPPRIAIDLIGVGSSPYDSLRKHYGTRRVVGFNASAPVSAKQRDRTGAYSFFNLRSYATYLLSEALDPANGINLALPPSRTLRNDLRAIRFKTVSGKYVIEPKDQIKKRLGRSPDEGDAVIIAWWIASMAPRKWEI